MNLLYNEVYASYGILFISQLVWLAIERLSRSLSKASRRTLFTAFHHNVFVNSNATLNIVYVHNGVLLIEVTVFTAVLPALLREEYLLCGQ